MSIDIRISPLFSSLSDEHLNKILDSSHKIKLEDGQSLFETGDPAERFFFVAQGQIKLCRLSAEGNEKIIDIIQPGSTFAEALMFLQQPAYPVSAMALGGAQLVSFDNQRFLSVLRGSTDTCFRVLGTMSQRLRGLIKEIDDLTLQSATSRVCGMLLRHRQKADADEFILHAPKGALASRLSVKPETFSRILGNLSNQRIIQVKSNHVLVLDADKLRELAHLESMIGLEELPACPNPCPLANPTR